MQPDRLSLIIVYTLFNIWGRIVLWLRQKCLTKLSHETSCTGGTIQPDQNVKEKEREGRKEGGGAQGERYQGRERESEREGEKRERILEALEVRNKKSSLIDNLAKRTQPGPSFSFSRARSVIPVTALLFYKTGELKIVA